MGVDITVVAERRVEGRWEEVTMSPPLFDWRSYALFGFLADVRNYSAVTPLSEPRGIPSDSSVLAWPDDEFYHSYGRSWFSIEELCAVDPKTEVEDRRVTGTLPDGTICGGLTCPPGKGVRQTLAEFLGEGFFDDVARAKAAGVERIVFYFDT